MFKGTGVKKKIAGFVASTVMAASLVVPAFAASSSNTTVYVTKTGSCYHVEGCEELENGSIKTTLQTAESMGYDPCPKCDPPTSSSSKSSSSNKNSSSETVVTTEEDEEVELTVSASDSEESSSGKNSSDSSDKNSSSSSSNSSSSSKTSASSGSSSSSSSNGVKSLMTEKQRRSKFKSTTNPKMGTVPETKVSHADSLGFVYGDFGTFNNYASKNGLGGTKIYLLGTFMDIQKVTEANDYYGLAMMVNDCDGYQWYIRFNCAKSKYDLLRNTLLGKSAYIYGTYSGYSGVTYRPMMDVTAATEVGGQMIDLVATFGN